VAYQGAGRGLGGPEVIGLCEAATDGLWPDLTILLRIDPEAGLARAGGDDRFEAEGVALQRAVAQAYEEIAMVASDRMVAVDATGEVDEVHRRVMEVVAARA
jgi:dTMP kinase